MNIRNLIPTDKFNTETAEKLKNFSYDEIKPIIPELLEWIQDMNWPVARPVADYLQTLTDHLSEEILKILHSEDEMWKYWTIGVFGALTKDQAIINEIIRIANNPTEAEIENDVRGQAHWILEKRKSQADT